MKKLLFLLFAALLFSGEAWGGEPVSELKQGHYYRIRYSKTGHYLCWAGQEGVSSNSINAFRQPMILVSAEKALTSPGSIFRYEKVSSRDGLYTQGVEVGEQLSNYYVAFENLQSIWIIDIRAASWGTNSTLEFSRPDKTSRRFSIKTTAGTTGYWEENYKIEPDYPDGYLNITTSSAGLWYFEEVDGASANNASNDENKNMGSFLGFPPKDETYNVKFHYVDNGTTKYGYTNDGPRKYEITDVQSGADADNTTWYYATMCLPFPVEVPSNVQCFFVNSNKQTIPIEYNDNNLNGTGRFAKKVNVIPAGTPFVARSQSDNPDDNRFVPYIAQATVYAPTNNNSNALKKAKSYLVKPAYVSGWFADHNDLRNQYILSITNNGKVEFLTKLSDSQLTDGNRAYFGSTSDPIVYEPTETELADLIYEGDGTKWTDKDYVKISDPLLVCYVNVEAGLVFARDMENNKNYWTKVVGTPDNYYNFAPDGGGLTLTPDDYNQSNWVIIQVPKTMAINFHPGMTISGRTLKGAIENDKTTPLFNMAAVENPAGDQQVNLNTYSVAHLMADNTTHLLKSGKDGEGYYFFMTPKPAEVAEVTWAIPKLIDNNFYAYIPANDNGTNGHEFHGRVLLLPNMYAGSISDWSEETWSSIEGKAIRFKAVITAQSGKTSANAPRRAEGASIIEDDDISTQHVVYPLEFDFDSGIVTSVEGVKSSAAVTAVKFYNLQGMESDTPFNGINIVVEHLNDGTTRSSKMRF